jgi:hypothetical protein
MSQSRYNPSSVYFPFRALAHALFLLLVACPVSAQVDDNAKTQEKIERQKALERQTFILVDEVASGAASLRLPENRSYVLAVAADLLWDQDEKRARALFWESLNTFNILGEPSSKNSSKSDRNDSYLATFGLRQTLLRLVARHDPDLALELLRTTRQTPPENSKYHFPDDHDLEQQIAIEAAARDPERALQLARDSLARGLSFDLLNLAYKLNDMNQELGSKFAGQIIDKLKTENLGTVPYGPYIAVRLLVDSRERKAETARLSSGAFSLRQLKLEEGKRRELAELIANAALSVSVGGELLYAVKEARPELEEFTPERMRLLESRVAEFNRKLPKEEKAWADYNNLVSNATPEEILRASNKADSDRRAMLQQQAIGMALLKGRADSLREVINNEIDDDSRRKGLLDSLNAGEINFLIYNGDTAGLRKLLPHVGRKEDRARALAQIAVMLEEKGDHDEAVKLVGEAESFVKIDLRSETKSTALFGLMLAYALIEPSKAFVIVERTIDRANDEVSKAALLDKISKTGAFKKGEIILQYSGSSALDFGLFNYGKGVAALAKADFARTKAAADRFQRNELRLMSRLLIARAVLRSEKQISTIAR